MYIWSMFKKALIIGLLASIFGSQAFAELLPVEHFAKLPVVSNPLISPDGKRVAMTIVSKGKPVLVVQPLDKKLESQGRGKISVGKLHIHNYTWVNNTRLVLAVRDSARNHDGNLWGFTRLIAIDWNGQNPVGLKMQPNQDGYLRQYPKILHILPADDKHVLALLDDREDDWNRPHIHKVNVYTGKKTIHQPSYLGVQEWFADNEGNVLVGEKHGTRGTTKATTYYRANEKDKWQALQRSDYFESERLIPHRIHEEKNHVLLLSTRSRDEDDWDPVDETELELYEYDLELGKVTGPYQNEKLASISSRIRQLLPGLSVRYVSSDLNKQRYIFSVYSDSRPHTYYLYLAKQNHLMKLGREYPELDGKATATMEKYEYKARDGLRIPAFFTRPTTKPPTTTKGLLPLIVYPHGGPWAHDEWGFDSRVQFFANRGYAVFQPQFRGSTGYGLDHEEAGYGQWGDAIQDDITDGVLDLVNRGVVDKNRICIVGASFGGYAAAMGLVKTPELYRCAISINGVLDLQRHLSDLSKLLFTSLERSLNSSEDAAAFSPYHNTQWIRVPMLLIAGKKDTVVPYQHSKRMYKRLKREGKEATYLEFKDGEHWRTNEANEIKAWQAIDEFLALHLPVD